jgi:dihydrolipoamide dehydrogenase
MSETTQFDIGIIGAGPAGYVAAIRAAQLGASVALVERAALGGTCLNWGCIPSKALIATAHRLEQFKEADRFGIEVDAPKLDLAKAMKRKDRILDQLRKGIAFLLERGGVTLFEGSGKLLGPNEVGIAQEDGEREISCRHIILAVGSEPLVIPLPGHDLPQVITSDDAVHLTTLPASMAVMGGGPIGVELAYVYSRFGAKVTVLEMLPQLVPTEDEDVAEVLTKRLKRGGVKVLTGAKCEAIEPRNGGVSVKYAGDGDAGEVEAEIVLMAVGRRARLAGLDLEAVGVETERGQIKVDDERRTTVSGILAVGDCLRGAGLAHLASHEGIAAVETALGHEGHVNYDVVPACTFTVPEVASVGLKEKDAEEQGIAYKVGRFEFRSLGKALAENERDGFAKVLADPESGQVIGGHIVGPGATELIAELTLAMQKGLTIQDIGETIHAHPTLPEAVMEAALDSFGLAVHK